MKRGDNVFHFKITHIYFENDSLVFVSKTPKGYHVGKEHVET